MAQKFSTGHLDRSVKTDGSAPSDDAEKQITF
jgi:hypothetical protein